MTLPDCSQCLQQSDNDFIIIVSKTLVALTVLQHACVRDSLHTYYIFIGDFRNTLSVSNERRLYDTVVIV